MRREMDGRNPRPFELMSHREILAYYATWGPVKIMLYRHIKHAPLQVLLGPAPWMWICDKIPPEAIAQVLKARFPKAKPS